MFNIETDYLTIGNLQVPRIMAAPLDGITDSPMRRLIRQFSPHELLFGEMRHVACVVHQRSDISLKYDAVEHPVAFQFSANSTEFVAPAVERVIAAGFDMINLNIGCPARAVIRSGSGCALMAEPEKLRRILEHFMHCIADRVPFTVKMRAGFKEKNAPEIAQLCQQVGVPMIIIHPRTQAQEFTGLPDVALVAAVKARVSIPVIFSGNVNSYARAQKMYEQSHIDGVMIGRALWGAPWKMQEIVLQSRGQSLTMTPTECIDHAITHLRYTMEHYGERGFITFRKQLPVYLKGIAGVGALRAHLLTLPSGEALIAELRALQSQLTITPSGMTSHEHTSTASAH